MGEESKPFKVHGRKGKLEEVEADEVLEAIAREQDVDIEYANVEGDLDIVGIRVIRHRLGKEDTREVKANITIRFSEIHGKVYFSESFFSGRVSFEYSSISESVDFTHAIFDSSVGFFGINFRGNTDFKIATFNDAVFFDGSNFNGTAFFNQATFAKSWRSVGFVNVSFNGGADFAEARFCRLADFRYANFSRGTDFSTTYFSPSGVNFDEAKFGIDPKLDKAKLAQLPPWSFDSIGWAYRKSFLFGAGYFFEQAGKGHWARKEYSNAEEESRNAKMEYEKEGKHDKSKRMYVKEKDSTRLHVKVQKGNPITYAWLTAWKYSSNYGESPLRFIGWVISIVLFFAIIYMPIMSKWFGWWPSITFEKYPFHQWSDGIINGVAYNIVTAVYFSAVTFATLGFGDIAPVSICGKVCAIAEVLLGYLMFGVLITLVARKMTRS